MFVNIELRKFIIKSILPIINLLARFLSFMITRKVALKIQNSSIASSNISTSYFVNPSVQIIALVEIKRCNRKFNSMIVRQLFELVDKVYIF